MARATQTLEFDLRSGIETDESPLLIGGRLRRSENAIWQLAGSTDEQRRRVLSFAPQRDTGQQIATLSGVGPVLAIISLSVDGDFKSGGIVVYLDSFGVAQVRTLKQFDIVTALGESITLVQDQIRSGWAIVWTGIATAAVYFGHPKFGAVYQHLAPGDTDPVATPYGPSTSPFASDSLTTNTDLNPTTLSSPAAQVGETALTADTYHLQITGVSSNGRETDISASVSTAAAAGDVVQFTVPALPVDFVRTNLYARKGGAGNFILQKTDIAAGVYHLNGNGFSSAGSDPVVGFKFNTTGTVRSPGDDIPLNPSAVTAQTRIAPEKALSAGTYFIFLWKQGVATDTSPAVGGITIASGQVLQFTTPAESGLLLFARKGTSGNYHQQNPGSSFSATPLDPSTTYRLNLTNPSGKQVSGSPSFTGIMYSASGPAPNSTIPNIVDGIIHLERMFLLQATGNGRSTAFYTDPLDPDTIRATNFVSIPFDGTCMFRTTASSVDASAASHLCFGGTSSIWVLDGDPTLGNAILRRLTYNIGIADRSCVTETAAGAVILATDGQFYLIPAGAVQLVPLGHKDLASNYEAAYSTARASLAYASPYVFYCPNTLSVYLVDISGLGQQQPPKWWGPSDPSGLALTPTLARVSSIVPEAGADQVDQVYYLTLIEGEGSLDIIARGSPGTMDERIVELETGFLSVADHKAELRKVVLEYARPEVATSVTITALRPDGTSAAITRALQTATEPTPDLLGKTVFDFARDPVVCDAIGFRLSWPAATQPDLHRAYAEVRTQPKQDS